MTVKENMEIVLRINKKPPASWNEINERLLNLVQLDPVCYLNRYPDQLSGGEQQRVGVARALATDSDCLLMDEPFGALDAITRCELQDQLLQVKAQLKKTIIFVTHDIGEAFKIGDRIAVMRKGVLEQVGTKKQLTCSPQTSFVAQLVKAFCSNDGTRVNV
jgi:osmoprotectant transport system ATP-binding protein